MAKRALRTARWPADGRSHLTERLFAAAPPAVVLFCGGRDCVGEPWRGLIYADVLSLPKGSVVLHGDATGADAIAERVATQCGFHTARVSALWDQLGRKAGPLRNRAMLLLGPSFAFCYSTDGPGTRGMIELLREAGVPHIVRWVE